MRHTIYRVTSFEQTGAGATAAAVGTAFGMDCDAEGHCTTYAVVDNVEWTGDNAIHLLAPLDVCDSTDAIICADITHITPDQLPQWIIENLFKDVLAGYPWPFPTTPISGTVIVEDGNVFFIPSPPPTETTPLPPAPTVPSSAPINISSPPTGDADHISTDEDTSVVFTINVTSSGGQTVIRFTDLPHPTAGKLYLGNVPGETNCAERCVNPGQMYPAGSTFTFVPDDVGSAGESTSFTFIASNEGGSSAPTTVPVEVSDNDSLSTDSTSTEPESTPEPGS